LNDSYLPKSVTFLKIIETLQSLREWLAEQKQTGLSLGLVPTMGALHQGHLSIVKRSVEENDITVCSIFVNPTQFNDKEDFEKYPVNHHRDIDLLQSTGCSAVFLPSAKDIYPDSNYLTFDFGALGSVLEGAHRPGHFSGVATIVSKLFHLVMPDRAYFGKKDYQQLVIVRCMVRELSFPIEIVACDTVREPSGLAMSSRNERLSSHIRTKAGIIYHTMQAATTDLTLRNWPSKRQQIINVLVQNLPLKIEYLELGDPDNLQTPDEHYQKNNVVLFFAGVLEGVRLIDNITIQLN
jgi:pantoate--beta-alanine ligase